MIETVETKRLPGVEGLFTWPADEPHLIGAKCASCGTYFFPRFAQLHKPGCEGGEVEDALLSRQGKLVSYTVEYYPPPPPYINPDPYVPLVIGTIALPEGIQVPGQLMNMAAEDLRTGVDVELVIDKMCSDEEGNELLTWKFRPLHRPQGDTEEGDR